MSVQDKRKVKLAVLERLVARADASIGCPAAKFADMLCEMGISEWAPFLKSLCEDGIVRLDPPKGSRTEPVIKVTNEGFEVLKLT